MGRGIRQFLLTTLTAAVLSGAPTGPAAADKLPIGGPGDGLAAMALRPTAAPPGANDWSCRPSQAHPYPVVLVHGTLANAALSWQALSPLLANAGYCVYALNYGANGGSAGRFFGLTDIAASAAELDAFVERVRGATGAAQVDLVGHSQGGMMPRYYLKHLGGAARTHMLVGLAPSNHGTTLLGLNRLLQGLSFLGVSGPTLDGCVACAQQILPSEFLTALNSGGETVPGPRYRVIETAYDEVVTPSTSAYLSGPGVRNLRLQDACPSDYTGHVGIIYDPVALELTLNALGADDPGFRPHCRLVLPLVGAGG
jgi:triacylglycerol esterase/lipase EstA (alpha/beta hydrolase family)